MKQAIGTMINVEKWREPDVTVEGNGFYSVWYGPEGEDGDCATEVEGNTVRQYQHVGGYFDVYLKDRPFLCTETYVEDIGTNDPRALVAVGIDQISEFGGEETMENSLP